MKKQELREEYKSKTGKPYKADLWEAPRFKDEYVAWLENRLIRSNRT